MDLAPYMLAGARLIGWVLLHSLWQGALLGLAYGGCRSLTRRGEQRYRLGLAALGALVLMQGITLWMLWPSNGPLAVGSSVVFQAAIPATTGAMVPRVPLWTGMVDAALPWITLAWSSGVLLLASRAGVQWLDLRRLVRAALPAPAWQERLDRLAAASGVAGRVRILRSGGVSSPVLVGVIRPVILLPVAVMCCMPVAQVELILAHELAHVRRLDPLANLLQMAIETLYFHHPAVRWISREVRNEREICCDRAALSGQPGSRREYIEALATLGELSRQRPMVLASNGGLLLERVQLIASPLQTGEGRGSPARVLALGLGLLLAAGAASHAWGLVPPVAPWPLEPSQIVRIVSDGMGRQVAWALADLAPRRASPAYPRVLPGNGLLPQVPPAFAGDLHRSLDEPSVALAFVPPDAARRISLPVSGPLMIEPRTAIASAEPTPVRVRQPRYPRQALVAGIEGAVVIEFGLSRSGMVQDMRVVHSDPEGVFDQAAMAALRDWRYTGPVAAGARYRQTIGFTLHGPATRQGNLHEARAVLPCAVVTGTHICRFPEGVGPLVVSRP